MIELHVVTGVFILCQVLWQFLKAVRQWSEFLLHRWIGRALLLLVVPNQLAISYLETTGLFDSDVSPHSYDKIFKVSLAIPGVIILTCLSLAIYHIKNKDYAKHGEFMMRTMGIWFAIPFVRMIRTAVSSFTGFRDSFPIAGFLCWILPLICAEWYIRNSERFVKPTHKEDAGVQLTAEG